MRTELLSGTGPAALLAQLTTLEAPMPVLGVTRIENISGAFAKLVTVMLLFPSWSCIAERIHEESCDPSVIPGFGITLGFTTFFLCAMCCCR